MADEKRNANVALVERKPAQPPVLFDQMDREFATIRQHMLELFRRPFPRLFGPPLLTETIWAPTTDAYEKDGTLVIKAELPGVKTEDVRIAVEGGYLTIDARRAEEKEAKDARYYTSERFVGSLRRSFALPEGLDASAVTAEFRDGVLEVRVPLPAQAKSAAVQIPIKS